jgi:DNA polymerase IV
VWAILHVDMDAFYASVEERDRPELKGTLLIVGGTGGRGVVAAASYAVRRFGVRSAMPMREALQRCPEAVCVPPRMARYQAVSAQIFAIFREFTPLVQGLSLDEAFLDVTASRRLKGDAEAIAAAIRHRIRSATELCASVGIAPNKLLAKIASDLAKPDGMFRIGPENLHEVLDALPIQRLFGVGPKSLPGVQAAGIHTIGDAARASEQALWRAFGRHGRAMQALARGIDARPVAADREERTLSAEETFARDIRDPAELDRHLTALADRAAARLRAHGLAAGRISVKIRRADFKTYTRQCVLGQPTQDTAVVSAAARRLLAAWRAAQPDAALRLLGVGTGDLGAPRQADLFVTEPARDSRLDAAVDGIRERFGSAVLTRASLLPRGPRTRSGPRRG